MEIHRSVTAEKVYIPERTPFTQKPSLFRRIKNSWKLYLEACLSPRLGSAIFSLQITR